MYASVAAIFYLFNLRMIIHNYSTLHTNMVGIAYITVMVTMFILLIMLNVIFYFIVNALIQKAELDDRNRILEMQEKQFESLRDYLDSDAKARHDFRQTIYTLTELSDEKDYQAIDEYLHKYRDELPQKETIDFCEDNALNALLNHYSQKAEKNEIRTDFQVSLPAEMNIDSIDLCSVVGNILENAVIACCDVDVEKRFIRVVISAEQNSELYIAIVNSFSGELRQIKDRYLSTHKGGNGIGLISVEATAARYGGSANWSNDNGVFYSDVVLVNNCQ
jgi:sensor histidine kinase regulating citrate/malate metabolism